MFNEPAVGALVVEEEEHSIISTHMRHDNWPVCTRFAASAEYYANQDQTNVFHLGTHSHGSELLHQDRGVGLGRGATSHRWVKRQIEFELEFL